MAWSLNASDGPEATPSSAAGDLDLSSNFAARLGSVTNRTGVDSSVVIVAGVALTIAFGFGLVAVMRSK